MSDNESFNDKPLRRNGKVVEIVIDGQVHNVNRVNGKRHYVLAGTQHRWSQDQQRHLRVFSIAEAKTLLATRMPDMKDRKALPRADP